MISQDKFIEKMSLIADPYFDREFFTNLIYLIDRKASIRTIFEGFLEQLTSGVDQNDELDRSLLQLFYAFQSSSLLRDNYQWLPMAQGMYAAALFRSDGQKPIFYQGYQRTEPQASSLQEFSDLIRRETRSVESPSKAWASFLFLTENRSSRVQAISTLLANAVLNADSLSLELLAKGADVAVACGFKSNEVLLRRPFARFWANAKPLEVVTQGWRLAKAARFQMADEGHGNWNEAWSEEIWNRLCHQSAESAWEQLDKYLQQGMSTDQAFTLLMLLRGRCLFGMKTEQWSRATASCLYGDALQTVARWCPDLKLNLLATSLVELARLSQACGIATPLRPTGDSVLDGVSKNISKDRLILRLDDAVERGQRHEALEVMAVLLNDQGLSNSICDRLILMASKQDAWSYDQRTLAVGNVITRAYDQALRIGISGSVLSDAIYGLLRFLSDERDAALEQVARTGTYGDGLGKCRYDVSGGARIVDRFVFNQMRNAQRVKVWPSDN